MLKVRPNIAVAVGSTGLALALLLAGCSTPSGTPGAGASGDQPVTQADIDKAMSTKSSITFWSWLPDVQNEIKLFEAKYPNITVNYANAGQGGGEYTKLRTVLKAGKGVPDVVQVEFQYIPSFESSLADLTPYGGNDLATLYSDSVFKQVQISGKIYGVPQDTAPMGNLYRKDVLDSVGITAPPKTWDEYTQAAKTLKDKKGDFISDFPSNQGGQMLGLLWAAGAKPFSFDGDKTVKINLQSPETKKVADYWTTMVQQGLVDTAPDFNNDWFQGFASGKYAGWLTAAWGPDQIISSVKSSSGQWRAAPLPQWDPAKPSSGNWGGSTLAVPKLSQNKIVAYEFAKFLNTDADSVRMETTSSQALYPALLSGLKDPAWVNQKVDFFGGQQVNKLFSEISGTIDPNWQWLPYMDFAYTEYATTVGKAIAAKTSIYDGLKAWQDSLVAYGTQQGYTVQTG